MKLNYSTKTIIAWAVTMLFIVLVCLFNPNSLRENEMWVGLLYSVLAWIPANTAAFILSAKEILDKGGVSNHVGRRND